MINKELIYDMAKRLDLAIEVWKKGLYIGIYKFIGGRLIKIK